MQKIALFAFNGNPGCFTHVLLNALDMHTKGFDVRLIIEGEAVKLVKTMLEAKNPLFQKVVDLKLIDCICKGCSAKMGVLEFNQNTGLPVCGEMSGHPPFSAYMEKGYKVVTL
ncbi:MAG: hypothetical protein WCY78_05430 [Sphaerochaetaceae bacterium]